MPNTQKRYQNKQAGYTHTYTIVYRWEGSYYTVWAFERPDDPYGKDDHTHHLGKDGKLCQRQGYESKTFEHAEAYAHWWMKRFSIYVTTGKFPMTSEKINL